MFGPRERERTAFAKRRFKRNLTALRLYKLFNNA